MAQEPGEGPDPAVGSLGDRRAQLDLLSRTLEREAHILQREPEALSSHLHNMLYLDQGEESPAGPPVRADLLAPGQIIAWPVLGGLHHEYEWVAA